MRPHLYRAQQAMRIATERDAEGRVWCQLFPLGTWHRADFPGGKLDITPELLEAFVAAWRAEGSPPLPVDYNHDEEGPAAGWIEALRLSPTGELEGAVRWTARAAEEIRNDERRYLSPTWAMQHVNRRTGEKGGPWLYGAALLNQPFYDVMPRVAASADAGAPVEVTTSTNPNALRGKESKMNKARICAALGLPEDTEDDKVMEAIEAAFAAKKASAESAEKLTAALGKAADETAKLAARVTALEGEKKALEAAAFEKELESILKAPKAGLPALGETLKATAQAMGLDAVRKLVAALPDVPTTEAGISGTEAPSATDAQAQFDALVVEKMKAGMKTTEAYAAVTRENRALADKLVLPYGENTNTTASA